MARILIYADQGVDGASLKQLIRSLTKEVDLTQHSLCRIDAKKLIEDDWQKETQLLIVPGGRDIFYHSALNGIGTEKIRAFVHGGGGYLGICAGAYFACDRIEFEKGEALEVCADRSLKFFSGVAKGPAFGNNRYSYETAKGAEAARISWGHQACHIYFNGGCVFEPDGHFSETHILSRYLDLPRSPLAILHLPIGKGKAILSGVHVEYQASLLPHEDAYLAKLAPVLASAEEGRRQIFREIIGSYGVRLAGLKN